MDNFPNIITTLQNLYHRIEKLESIVSDLEKQNMQRKGFDIQQDINHGPRIRQTCNCGSIHCHICGGPEGE